MPYSKQTWNEIAGSANAQVTAVRMNWIETGIETAQATAENHLNDVTSVHGIPDMTAVGLTIIEITTGNWSADAPVRTVGDLPITFKGASDPADPTNGINTPANINAGDEWLQI